MSCSENAFIALPVKVSLRTAEQPRIDAQICALWLPLHAYSCSDLLHNSLNRLSA